MSALIALPARAQTLVHFERTGTLEAARINARARAFFSTKAPARARESLVLYRVVYTSTDGNDRPVRLSGLLALPRSGAPRGLVLWSHGTITRQREAPSNFRVNDPVAGNEIPILALASGGYAIAMPDYLGYGEHRGPHPYPMGRINARAGLDMIAPARAVATRINCPLDGRLWVSGHSEGGAVALWTLRWLEARGGQRPVRTSALSGPYDLTGVTLDSLTQTPRDPDQFGAQMFLVGFLGYNFARGRGHSLSTLFRPPVALGVRRGFERDQPTSEAIRAILTGASSVNARNVSQTLAPEFRRAIEARDLNHPLLRELAASNAFNWAPRGPLLLWSLEGDSVVPAANDDVAMQSFRARGAGTDRVRAIRHADPSLNHATALVPAVLATRAFFDGGFAALPTAR